MHQQIYNTTTTAAAATIRAHQNGLPGFADNLPSHYAPIYSQIRGAIIPRNNLMPAFRPQLGENILNRDVMDQYLRERNDLSIVILYPKVAQKSSASQKRYIFPPPCVYPLGNGWRYRQEEMLRKGESMQGALLCAFMGASNSDQDMQQLTLNYRKKCFAAETLYISESEKRKDIPLSVKMFYGNGRYIGQFNSKKIKVMSRPSKINLLKNADMYVASGTNVALFNNLGTERNGWTRYLHINNGHFCGSSTDWSSFQIQLVDDNKPEEFQDGFVHYGATVKLVCLVTGIISPRLVIRKVVRTIVLLEEKNPVLKLEKCAFYVKDTERMYLCLSHEKIIQIQAIPCPNEPNKENINDTASWNIVDIEKTTYKFYGGVGPVRSPLTPVPIVNSLNNDSGFNAGLDIRPQSQARFGNMTAETWSRCAEALLCVVPDVSEFRGEWLMHEQFQSGPPNNLGTTNVQCIICKIFCYSHKHLDTHMKVHSEDKLRRKICQIPFTSGVLPNRIQSEEERITHVGLPFSVGERQQLLSGQINNNPNAEELFNPPPINAECSVTQDDLLDQALSENAGSSFVESPSEDGEELLILEQQPNSTTRFKEKSNLPKKKMNRRKRCGQCIGCQEIENCGNCAPCKNDKCHQVCKQRRCEDLLVVETQQSDLICEICNKRCLNKKILKNHIKIHSEGGLTKHKVYFHPDRNSSKEDSLIVELSCIEEREQNSNGPNKTFSHSKRTDPSPIHAEYNIKREVSFDANGDACVSFTKGATANYAIPYQPDQYCSLVELPCIEDVEQHPNGQINETFPNDEEPLDTLPIYGECDIKTDLPFDLNQSSGDGCVSSMELPSQNEVEEITISKHEPDYIAFCEENRNLSEKVVYNCDECDKSFSQIWYLQLHRTLHRNLQYSCNVCSQIFNDEVELENHNAENHRKLKCYICKKYFPTLSVLDNHINNHTVSEQWVDPVNSVKSEQSVDQLSLTNFKRSIQNSRDESEEDCISGIEERVQSVSGQKTNELRSSEDQLHSHPSNAEFDIEQVQFEDSNVEHWSNNGTLAYNSRATTSTTVEKMNLPEKTSKKRKRCRECIGCQRKGNCGDCAPCRSDTSHQICKERRCEKLTCIKNKKSRNVQSKNRKKRYGECIDSQQKDNCGDCIPSKNDKYHQIPERRCRMELINEKTNENRNVLSGKKRKRCDKCIGCRKNNCGYCPSCRNDGCYVICKQRRCEKLTIERCDQLPRQNESAQKVSITLYQCKTCKTFCCTKESLDQHQKLHDGAFKCKFCNIRFTKRSLWSHQKRSHRAMWKKRIYLRLQCDICQTVCPSRQRLEQHMKVHSKGESICKICRISFSKTALVIHETRCHPGTHRTHILDRTEEVVQLQTMSHREMQYSCNVLLSNGIDLENYTETNSFECYVCKRLFPTLRRLNNHINKHTVYSKWVDPLSIHLSNWSQEKYQEILQHQPLVMVDKLDINSINLKSLANFGSNGEENIVKELIDLSSDDADSDIEIVNNVLDAYHCYFCDSPFCSLRDLGVHVEICSLPKRIAL